jgi:hypothetical protein
VSKNIERGFSDEQGEAVAGAFTDEQHLTVATSDVPAVGAWCRQASAARTKLRRTPGAFRRAWRQITESRDGEYLHMNASGVRFSLSLPCSLGRPETEIWLRSVRRPDALV